MSTWPPQPAKTRTRGAIHPFDSIRGVASSSRSNEESDKAVDFEDDQDSEDNDSIEEKLGDTNDGTTQSDLPGRILDVQTSDQISTFSGAPVLPRVSLDPGQIYDGSHGTLTSKIWPAHQKHPEEAKEEKSHLLSKLTISRDQTEASNFDNERLLAITSEKITDQVARDQDYQIYLAMLEQQRNSRLLMARRKQNTLDSGISDPYYPGRFNLKGPLDTGLDSEPDPGPQQPPMDVRHFYPNYSTAETLQAHSETGDSELVDRLLKRIEELEKGTKKLEILSGQGSRPSRFQILHLLDNDEKVVCLQEPTWTFGEDFRLQLKAELPLVDLATHLRKNDDISFLVYKSYATPRVSTTELAESLEAGVLPTPEPSHEFIQILSEELRVALEQLLSSTHSVYEEYIRLSLGKIEAPYLFWYHARSKSRAFSDLPPKDREQLKLLVDWIDQNYAPRYKQFDEMISRGRISHAFMEYLFSTGDVVVEQDGEKTKAYRLHGVPNLKRVYGRVHHSQAFEKISRAYERTTKRAHANQAWKWDVSCWTIVYDGQFCSRSHTLTLELIAESHDEEVDINGLTIVPLRFVGKYLQEKLRRRGCTFWSCRIKRPISYSGDKDASHTDGERYVIDNKSYKKLHVDAQKSRQSQEFLAASGNRQTTPLFVKEMDKDEPPSAPNIYLFPPTIPGFSLRRKLWTDLIVDKITDISWNKEAFKHLVADDKTKELVQALVADRISGDRNTDIIQGKGNGLIILLHGGPGTGKTFTAESVAELAEKPLYPVTCGDIGTEPEHVERYLESVLYLGNIWDCVVLLDEADVFLEERGIADLARNALVSVFLRVLEYYDGILILTSNRVGTFDEAFKSRISLALHYPNFTKSQRCRIWKNFLNRLKALKEPDIDFDDIECNVLELADKELNGRQIRNAITIGRQLAKFQKKELSYAHLKHVVEVAGQFETYLKRTKEDLSDEQIARLHGRR
ncbi:hypothetical protein HBI17_069400 [Parastagonospora nodorum]|nr:hypothetical protein HBI17_069400 [Parastagonospora nodorum]